MCGPAFEVEYFRKVVNFSFHPSARPPEWENINIYREHPIMYGFPLHRNLIDDIIRKHYSHRAAKMATAVSKASSLSQMHLFESFDYLNISYVFSQ